VDGDTADRLGCSKAYLKLAESEQERLRATLSDVHGLSTTDRKEALTAFTRTLGSLDRDMDKAILDAIAVRDPDAAMITRKGERQPDPDLRDNENVPLPATPVRYEADPSARFASGEYHKAVEEYVTAEVLPYVPDAWIDHTKTKIGYEVPLTRHFYRYQPPRPLEEIDAEIKQLEKEIQALLEEVTE
jgi:type I restriction enzyme M protein